MAKKKQSDVSRNFSSDRKSQGKKQFVKPDVTNMDDIALLLDDDLYAKCSQLEEVRNNVINAGQDSYYWDVELAYFKREIQLRKIRHDIHETWIKEQISLTNVDESNLPYADFDNLKYVMVNLYEKTRNRF